MVSPDFFESLVMVGGVVRAAVGSCYQPLRPPVLPFDVGLDVPLPVFDLLAAFGLLRQSFFGVQEGPAAHVSFWGLVVLIDVLEDLAHLRRDTGGQLERRSLALVCRRFRGRVGPARFGRTAG